MPDLEISYVDDLPCHRCAATLVCAMRVPHSFVRADGFEVRGVRTVGLCPMCDNENPAVRAIFEHIARHGEPDRAAMLELAALVGEAAMRGLPEALDEELLRAAAAEFVRTTP